MANLPEYRVSCWATEKFGYEIHVYPVKDWQEHILGEICKCKPVKKTECLSTIYIHHSYDGRELFEELQDER